MARKSQSLSEPLKLLTDSDVAAAAVAAQQLMVLSEGGEDINISEKSRDEITSMWATIEEIFGKEEKVEEIYRPKKRRFRSLDSLYWATKPVQFDDIGGGRSTEKETLNGVFFIFKTKTQNDDKIKSKASYEDRVSSCTC